MSRRIAIAVDRLVLHGFDAGDRRRIGDAFELELTRLVSTERTPRLLTRSRAEDSLPAPSIHVAPGMPPHVAGRRAAAAVYHALDRRGAS
jgi:hypothetical protein